jgi:hypothetical protein
MTQTEVSFWSARSNVTGGLETITGTPYGDNLVRAATWAPNTARQQMGRSGVSLLPLTAAVLGCMGRRPILACA